MCANMVVLVFCPYRTVGYLAVYLYQQEKNVISYLFWCCNAQKKCTTQKGRKNKAHARRHGLVKKSDIPDFCQLTQA